jgi:protein involved in polysaccharide export with SLBB domain
MNWTVPFSFALLLSFAVTLMPANGQGALLGQGGLPGPATGVQVPGQGTVPSGGAASVIPSTTPQVISDDSYRLGAGDKMKITVYDEPDLTGEFLVDGAGEVQFPLIGQIAAAGLTVHQFVESLSSALAAKYLRDPKVSVEIENYRPFYIIGEVNKPGEYPFESGMNVLNAVALAGGYTYRADRSDIRVRRNGSSEEDGKDINSETKIYPGDVIRIPERIF